METVNAVGRRKAAIARVIVKEGNGTITINKRPIEVYFPSSILQYIVKQPLLTLDVAEKSGYKVDALTANRDFRKLEEQIRKFRPKYAALSDVAAAAELRLRVRDTDTKVYSGAEGVSLCAEMSEAEVNSLLPGYKINQLTTVWGEPDTSEENTVSWKIGDATLIVNYKNNGVVAICGLKDDSGASVGE